MERIAAGAVAGEASFGTVKGGRGGSGAHEEELVEGVVFDDGVTQHREQAINQVEPAASLSGLTPHLA